MGADVLTRAPDKCSTGALKQMLCVLTLSKSGPGPPRIVCHIYHTTDHSHLRPSTRGDATAPGQGKM